MRSRIFQGYAELLRLRRREKAFHPNARQTILELSDALFTVLRSCDDHQDSILAIHNVTEQSQQVQLKREMVSSAEEIRVRNLLTQRVFTFTDCFCEITLAPYQFDWLKIELDE